jgi:hypothetical protein
LFFCSDKGGALAFICTPISSSSSTHGLFILLNQRGIIN